MSHILRVTGMFAIITLLAWWGSPAVAQEGSSTPSPAPAPAASPASEVDAPALEGIQEAVGRQYAADLDIQQSSPTPVQASPGAAFLVTARIITFDTNEHAAAAYAASSADAAGQFEALGLADTPQATEEELAGLGDKANVLMLEPSRDDTTGFLRILFVLDQDTVYILSAIGDTAGSVTITDDIANDMLSREPGDDAPVFNADGTSTGGLWETFPDTGDPVLRGMVVFEDQQIVAPSP
jgi:hypothetical protein